MILSWENRNHWVTQAASTPIRHSYWQGGGNPHLRPKRGPSHVWTPPSGLLRLALPAEHCSHHGAHFLRWKIGDPTDRARIQVQADDKVMPKSLLYLCGHVFPHVNADSKKSLLSHASATTPMERLTSPSWSCYKRQVSTLKHNGTLLMAKHVFQPHDTSAGT